jgi:hypothetical protein
LVKYPTDYQSQHILYTTVDKIHPTSGPSVRPMYVNREAFEAVKAGKPLPSGTVLTMEVYKAKIEADNTPQKDAQGRFIKGEFSGVFVMEKRTGWGSDYAADLRNGEWEYARFLPDGTRHAKTDMTSCLECHRKLADSDFVFTLPQLKNAAQ